MARKSKQPGGHNPLTYHERKCLTKYGTATQRLGTDHQLKFGHCCLSLTPVLDDAVCTPSGHIYSREAILSYLLAKKQEIKEEQISFETRQVSMRHKKLKKEEDDKNILVETFKKKDLGATQMSTESHAIGLENLLKRKINTAMKNEMQKDLKRTSFWLSDFQPKKEDQGDFINSEEVIPPTRPSSPMSKQPLRSKDLIPITLNWHNDKCTCAVSNKAITTQPVVLIKKTGVVMLNDVYEDLVLNNKDGQKNGKSKTLLCPITGKKFKDKNDVLKLQKGKSGFAASGEVVAKKYRPTLT